METIQVNTTAKYEITFHESFSDLNWILHRIGASDKKIFIITDENVGKIYLEDVKNNIANKNVFSAVFPAGEKNKNLSLIYQLYEQLLAAKLDRKSVIIGLGGGVSGDMAGFCAATYLRGVPFLQIPTTLLAQVDSSVGGKVGVDFLGHKNLIGSFYQPVHVYIQTNTLKTLPEREFNAGMAEVVKYGFIMDKAFLSFIEENKNEIKNKKWLINVIKQSCINKGEIVSQDEKEEGRREILNFGHTIGHAIETLMNFQLLHGECVAAGMVCALHMSYRRGFISYQEWQHSAALIQYFCTWGALQIPDNDKIYEQMFLDKKVKDNKINFILLKYMGNAQTISDVSKKEIFEALDHVRKLG